MKVSECMCIPYSSCPRESRSHSTCLFYKAKPTRRFGLTSGPAAASFEALCEAGFLASFFCFLTSLVFAMMALLVSSFGREGIVRYGCQNSEETQYTHKSPILCFCALPVFARLLSSILRLRRLLFALSSSRPIFKLDYSWSDVHLLILLSRAL